MGWSDRQRRMLAEFGLAGWLAPAPVAERSAEPTGDSQLALARARADVARAPHPLAETRSLPAALTAAPAAPVLMPGETAAASADGLDWTELQAAVACCIACGLCQGRTQTVFGVGHPSAHWMIVGEAPGEQEDKLGEPFVGRSGQLLDNMLRALGLRRDEGGPERQVYIANTLKCRPPGNRNPTADELATCEPFLIRQIGLVKPRIILAMGRFAVQSLLRSSEPIGRLRGRVHHYQGVPLVVTYHPAYLLRNPQEKARAWDDLCLAASSLAELAPAPSAAAPSTPAR